MTEFMTAGASLFEPREGDLTIGLAGRKGNRVVAVFERVPDVGDDGFELVGSHWELLCPLVDFANVYPELLRKLPVIRSSIQLAS